jgi:HTH-type transcriptional regulator/antitoxin HigA
MKSKDSDMNGGYFDLVRGFPLRPIRSDAELDDAIEILDRLVELDAPDRGQLDYLEVLADLVAKYEAERHPIPPPEDVDMLRHLAESRGVTGKALADATGVPRSTVSAVLNGKRKLTRGHVEAFAAFFKVSPAVFLKG